MRPRAFCDKLNEFFVDGYGVGAFLAFQTHVLQGPDDRQTFGPAVVPSMMSPGGVGLQEFIAILDTGTYSAVFHDGAIVIIQCRFNRDTLFAHRYTYIPCPVDHNLLISRPEEIALADWMREFTFSPAEDIFRSRGTYRFDYSRDVPHNLHDPHPASHLTFGSPQCRVPVRSPLSPASFLGFLFNNFYRPFLRIWQPVAPHLACAGIEQCITKEEQALHHLNWVDPA